MADPLTNYCRMCCSLHITMSSCMLVDKCMMLFCELQDDMSASFDEVITAQQTTNKELHRSQPYILAYNRSFFVMVDGSPIIVKPSVLSVALDHWLKAFFVFDVKYPMQVNVSCNLLQHTVLDMPAALSAKAMKFCTELRLD